LLLEDRSGSRLQRRLSCVTLALGSLRVFIKSKIHNQNSAVQEILTQDAQNGEPHSMPFWPGTAKFLAPPAIDYTIHILFAQGSHCARAHLFSVRSRNEMIPRKPWLGDQNRGSENLLVDRGFSGTNGVSWRSRWISQGGWNEAEAELIWDWSFSSCLIVRNTFSPGNSWLESPRPPRSVGSI